MTIEFKKRGRKSKRPSEEILAKMYKTMSAKEVGNELGVPEQTVRGWIRFYRRQATQQK